MVLMSSSTRSAVLNVVMIFTVIIIALAIVHMLGVQYMISKQTRDSLLSKEERFSNNKTNLMSPDDFIVYQGAQMPMSSISKIEFDNHESYPSVDGTNDRDVPRSMFAFAYNKCDPSCCPSPYMCSGGCVCMTDKQVDFIGKRGNNSAQRCLLKDNPEY